MKATDAMVTILIKSYTNLALTTTVSITITLPYLSIPWMNYYPFYPNNTPNYSYRTLYANSC